MAEALRLLRREHANLTRLLKVLDRQIALLGGGGQPDYDIIRGVVDYCPDFPDLCHHPKEDLVLAKLRQRDPKAAEKVGDLEGEHVKLAALTRRFTEAIERVLMEEELPRDWILGRAREFESAYRRHIAMEEQIFFPAAEHALGVSDWAGIDARVADRDDPLFGGRVAERFRALSEEVLALDAAV